MEEFIKEHESEFLDYMKFENTASKELESINEKLKLVKKSIEGKTVTYGKEFYIPIEEKSKRIYELNVKIGSLGIGKYVNKNSNAELSEKEKNDFDYETQLIPLIREKTKLENEIKKLKEDSKQVFLESQNVEDLENEKINIEEEINKRRQKLQPLIEENIKLNEKVLVNINKRKTDKVNELIEEINEKEKVKDYVDKKKLDDKELNELKEQTLTRLTKELEIKKQELKDITRDFDEAKHENIEELNKFEQLKTNLFSGNIQDLLKKVLKIEEYEDIKEQENFEEAEDFGEFFEKQCNAIKNNNQVNNEKIWKKDKNGNFYLANLEEEKDFIEIVKEKVSNTFKNIKNKLKDIKNKFNKTTEDTSKQETQCENGFKSELKVDINQQPVISINEKGVNNIEENVK